MATGIQALLADRDAEIGRLRAELAATLGELAALRALLAEANAHSAELVVQIGKLTEQVAKSNDRMAELLAIAQRKKKGATKPASEEVQTAPDLDEATRAAFEDRPLPPQLRGALHDRPRPKQRPTGRKPLPSHLPVDESTVFPPRCSCGCEEFEWVDEVVEDKLTVSAPPAHPPDPSQDRPVPKLSPADHR